MLEHLIEDALDGEAFRAGSLAEQRARLQAVTQILAEESDPTLRAMVKTYADQLSAKLLVRGQPYASLRELEAAVERALAGPSRLPPGQRESPRVEAVPHDRARSPARHANIALEILGAALDFPELLDEPEAEEALASLDGDLALAVAALRRVLEAGQERYANAAPTRASVDDGALRTAPPALEAPGHPTSHVAGEGGAPLSGSLRLGVYADEFLAQIPRSIHPFAVGRLASPAFETVDVARNVLLDNARKLSGLSLKRENAAEVEQLHRIEAQGDADKENELLRAVGARAQKRRGLS
jgi:DNA primase